MMKEMINSEIDQTYEDKYLLIVKDMVLSVLEGYSCRAFLFGSRTKGDYRRSSDYDVGVQALDPLDFRKASMRLNLLWEESLVPHKIDFVNFDTVTESFKEVALKEIVLWKDL